MQFHRIPQNVTRYEGRIVGKFTARQFTYLAIGGVIIFILLGLPIPSTYKVVIGAIDVAIAAILALVTYEGRSTDTWIVAFLKAVLHPTQRTWQKHEAAPEFLLPGYHLPEKNLGPKARDPAELEGFLRRLGGERTARSDFSEQEQATLQRIAELQSERG